MAEKGVREEVRKEM